MTGNSLDGADGVLLRIQNSSDLICEFIDSASVAFPAKLKSDLLALQKKDISLQLLTETQFNFGKWLAQAFSKKFKKVRLVGVHGQTLYHRSPRMRQKFETPCTLQLVEPGFLAAEFKCPVVFHFRGSDICLGGEGAPLAPFFHQNLARQFHPNDHISLHNLGGISNYTEIKSGRIIQAFDTGPANMALDTWIQQNTRGQLQYDPSGKLARTGNPDLKLVKSLLTHPYFKKRPPKSCGKQEFGEHWWHSKLAKLSLEDGAATLTEVVAISIAEAYRNFSKSPPKVIYFCGGGAKNVFLLERIEIALARLFKKAPRMMTTDRLNYPVETIEAAAFAYLAATRYFGKALDLPTVTGAKKSGLLGSIVEI